MDKGGSFVLYEPHGDAGETVGVQKEIAQNSKD